MTRQFVLQHTVLPLISLCVLTGCSSSAREFTSADEQSVRAASDEYVRLEVSGDAEKWAALSTTDAVMMPAGSKAVEGRDALIAWARQLPPGGKLAVPTREIKGYGNVALERGTYTTMFSPQPGAPLQTVTGYYLVVWERQPDGAWRIKRNIWNSEQP
jgi:uncharacterized protein (TIGR02246 family)